MSDNNLLNRLLERGRNEAGPTRAEVGAAGNEGLNALGNNDQVLEGASNVIQLFERIKATENGENTDEAA